MRTSHLIAIAASAVALAAPTLAVAASDYHGAGGEVGAVYHPGHASGQKTRAQVVAELDAARSDGSLGPLQRGFTYTVKNIGPAKTRTEVLVALDEARKDGTLTPLQRGFTFTPASTAR